MGEMDPSYRRELLGEQDADHLPKAIWWLRLEAFVLDLGISLLIGYVIGFINYGYTGLWWTTVICLFLNFSIGWKLERTLGMRVFRLLVVQTDGNTLSWLRIFWRLIAFVISLISIIGMLMIIFDKQRQGLHDKLAKTYVIDLGPPS